MYPHLLQVPATNAFLGRRKRKDLKMATCLCIGEVQKQGGTPVGGTTATFSGSLKWGGMQVVTQPLPDCGPQVGRIWTWRNNLCVL